MGTGLTIFGGQVLAVVMVFVFAPVAIFLWAAIGIWLLVDLIKVLIGRFKDESGRLTSSANLFTCIAGAKAITFTVNKFEHV